MGKRAIRAARRAKQRRRRLISRLIWSGLGLAVIGALGFLVWGTVRPPAGEAVPLMSNAGQHVPEGSDPGPFNSDPPTSGPHYAREFDAGFYDESSPQAQVPYPEGYIGHNLEHGYVIFWYNCEALNGTACEDLKGQIQAVMDDFDTVKLIAFPRPSLDVPVVMTSWGRMQRFETFDPNLARRFVRANRNRAPEPNAP